MSMFLRSNLKLVNLARLSVFRKFSQNYFNSLRLAGPCTGLVSHNGLFATLAHNVILENGGVKGNAELSSNNADAFREVDSALVEIDHAVKRTGRTVLESVEKIFEMIEKTGFATQTQSLYLIRCCGLLRLETPAKRIEVVNKMWNRFETLGVQFNVKHYNALLKVYLDSNENFSPSDILVSMERHNVEPNQATYCYLMEKYCHDGNLNGANEILECLKEKGIPVNEAIFNSLIKGHMKINDISGAQEIMEVMRNSNVAPSADSYTTLACGFAEKGDIEGIENVLSVAEENGITLQNDSYLQIILSLPSNEHNEFADKMLRRMGNIYEWRQDVINVSVDLIRKDLDDIAFKLILTISDPANNSGTNIFMKQMLKTDKPVERIVHYFRELYDKGLNSYLFLNAARASLEYGKLDCAVVFFKEMQKIGIPIRGHTFKPFFVASKHSPEGIWKVLKVMSELGLPADFWTYKECILPTVVSKSTHPENIFSKIQESGHSVSQAIDPLFQHYCYLGDIENASYLIGKYPVCINAYFNLEHLLSLYKDFRQNPDIYFQVLKYVLENIGLVGQNVHAIRGQQLAFFLQTNPKLFDVFHRSKIGQKQDYSKESLDVCSNIIRRDSPSLAGHLQILRNDKLNKRALKEITIEEEEQILKSSTDGRSNHSQLLDLLFLHIRNKDADRFNRVKSELDNVDFIYSPTTFSQIFFFHCEMNNLEAAKETLTKLKESYPTFKIDSAKLFDYARMLLRYARNDEALEVIKNDCKEINNFSGTETLLRSIRRFLNNVAQTGDVDLAKTIQSSLMCHVETYQIKENLLETAIKIYMYRKDYDSCLNEFENSAVNFRCSPCLNLLLKHFILAEDQSKLQTLVDIASKSEGSNKTLHQLALAFVELDRLQQARKIFENLGRSIDFTYLEHVGTQFYSQNRITELENLLYITTGLTNSRRDTLYRYLLDLHSRKNDYEKVGQVLDMMNKESIEPSVESKQLVNNLFSRNTQPLPFPNDVNIRDNNDSGSHSSSSGETLSFLDALNQGQADQALKELEKLKKGYVRTIPFKDMSHLIDLLVEKNILNGLSENVNAMSYIIEHSVEILKPLFEKYSGEGNVEGMTSLTNVFPDFSLKKGFFNAYLAKAYVVSNKTDDLLSELESRWDKKSKLFSILAFEEFLKVPHLEERAVQLARKYLEVKLDLPLGVVWAHYFSSENYEKAKEISQIHPIPIERIDSMILRTMRQTENINMGKKFVEIVSQSAVRDRSQERAYGALLDLLVLKQMYDDAVELVKDAKSRNVDLEKHYRSTLVTLKSSLERENKPVPFNVSMEEIQS